MVSKEIWKTIKEDEAYQVSNTGRVRSRMIVSSTQRNLQNEYHTHNHVDNLLWGTQRDNIHDSIQNGKFVGDTSKAIESSCTPILATNIDTLETLEFDSVNHAARILNLSAGHISEVLHHRLNRCGRWTFERI